MPRTAVPDVSAARTFWSSATAVVEPRLLASPLYVEVIGCIPTARLIWIVAVSVVAVVPVTVPLTGALVSTVNATEPVGAEPSTVAVIVTQSPTNDGFLEELSEIVAGGSNGLMTV